MAVIMGNLEKPIFPMFHIRKIQIGFKYNHNLSLIKFGLCLYCLVKSFDFSKDF